MSMRICLLATVLLLAGCGFQLRGTAALPFETIYIPEANAGIGLDLKRYVRSGTKTRVVDDEKSAQAILQFSGESRFRNILSLSGGGRVRELQLVYRIGVRVHDGKGGEFLPLTVLSLTRDLTYNDTNVLAKETEEALIYREIQSDMVQQILRRLSAAHAAKPVVQ